MSSRLACRAPKLGAILPKARALAAALVLGGLGLAGCAQQPQQLAAAGHPKEYFPSSVYGRASPRVVADGQPIPRGGGQYLVGKPYTVAGQTYYPSERRVTQVGLASWYGDAFHGRLTANGEVYDRDSFTAAHPTMPLPSYARVTNLRNNASMIVRVNDRGPYHSNRVMDVSRRVAEALDIRRMGTAKVKVEWVARASLAGSDDAKLAATLRTDGPARAEGVEERIMVAATPAPARVASLGGYAPRAIVENERPDRLEEYRAPRREVAERRRAEGEDDDDDRTSSIGRGRTRGEAPRGAAAHVPVPREVASPRERRETAVRHGEEFRLAGRDHRPHDTAAAGGTAVRLMAAGHMAAAHPEAPELRHPSHAATVVPPPARPARLVAVLPPARPSTAATRHSRSRAD